MYSDIGNKSNTMIFSERPGDINALMAQATSVVTGTMKLAASTKNNDDSTLNQNTN